MILSFIIGGILFMIIDYVVNKLDNPALGALISMVPIGFLSVFIVKKQNVLLYVKNILFVVCVTLFTTIVFYLLLRYIAVNKNFITQGILLLWLILQSLNYKFNIFMENPEKKISVN